MAYLKTLGHQLFFPILQFPDFNTTIKFWPYTWYVLCLICSMSTFLKRMLFDVFKSNEARNKCIFIIVVLVQYRVG